MSSAGPGMVMEDGPYLSSGPPGTDGESPSCLRPSLTRQRGEADQLNLRAGGPSGRAIPVHLPFQPGVALTERDVGGQACIWA
jgi:hypothetical protein